MNDNNYVYVGIIYYDKQTIYLYYWCDTPRLRSRSLSHEDGTKHSNLVDQIDYYQSITCINFYEKLTNPNDQ